MGLERAVVGEVQVHELPTTKDIHQIVLKHARAAGAERVLSVNLEISSISDLQDVWVQRYFDHLSRGTVAEGAKLRFDRVPAVFSCDACEGSFEVESVLGNALSCPVCHSEAVAVVSGRGYRVRDIEVL